MAKTERYYCDICKQEIDGSEVSISNGRRKPLKTGIEISEIARYDFGIPAVVVYDLCTDCTNALENIIKSEKGIQLKRLCEEA